MPKSKIMPGDWFIEADGIYECTGIFDEKTIKSVDYYHTMSSCTRLPASPKDLVKLYKLVDKMCSADYHDVPFLLHVVEQFMEKSKRKGTK